MMMMMIMMMPFVVVIAVDVYYKQNKVYAFSTVLFKLLGGLRPPHSLNKTSLNQCTLSITENSEKLNTNTELPPYVSCK